MEKLIVGRVTSYRMKCPKCGESGGSIKELQELLGHSDIKTTMIYTHLAPEHIKNAINRLK
jgi:site-specific recombinase XerC